MAVPSRYATKGEWIDYAIEQGLDRDDVAGMSRSEIADLFIEDVQAEPPKPEPDPPQEKAAPSPQEEAIQDQGSLDQPVQSTAKPAEASAGVGTPELREEARRRVTSRHNGVNNPREPFPWEGYPPGSA